METAILFTEDPAIVLNKAGEFLASQPVLHNLILSILHARITHFEPGRYWLAIEKEEVVGVVLQSPLTFEATLSPMDVRVVEAMVGRSRKQVFRCRESMETPRPQQNSPDLGARGGRRRLLRFRAAVFTNGWSRDR